MRHIVYALPGLMKREDTHNKLMDGDIIEFHDGLDIRFGIIRSGHSCGSCMLNRKGTVCTRMGCTRVGSDKGSVPGAVISYDNILEEL